MVTKICEVCGNAFDVRNYRKDKARFCSFQCGGKWHAQMRFNKTPKTYMKGNKFRQGKRPANAFTSEQVRGESSLNWVEGISFVCKGCGNEFKIKPWLARQNGGGKYCSQSCYYANRPSGKEHPLWVGGETTYRGRGWKEARLKVVERDKGCCQRCGKHVGKSISVHHKIPFREFADIQTANAPDNLICLCQSCHMKEEWSRSQ